MAVITFTELQDLIHGVTVTMTGLNARYVRHAYQTNSQPAFENAQNIAFINIVSVDNSYDKQIHTVLTDSAGQGQEVTAYTRVLAVDWTFYGPAGFDLADTVRNLVLSPPIRETLAAQQVFPIPGITAPQRGPSEFNNQWWERVDLRVLFNVGTVRAADIDYFSEINIRTQEAGGPSILLTIPAEE